MENPQLRKSLSQLFKEAGIAHHEAFAASNGDDPEWPLWYADYLREPLETLTGMAFTRSRLVYCLIKAEEAHQAREPGADWTTFYADRFIECYAQSQAPAEDELALYYMPTCPYCRRVLAVLNELGLDIELRNTLTKRHFRDELIAARGRGTVPVLWIKSPGGEVRWMPESLDIIDYLRQSYGKEKAA